MVLLTIVVSRGGTHCGGQLAGAQSQITNFETALDLYESDNHGYPTTAQGLEALWREPSPKPHAWRGPYMKKAIPLDPWGHAYHYRFPALHHLEGCDIWSDGPDGLDGTEDDIGNWRLTR